MLLMIDNYDSFTFNITRYCEELGEKVHIVRNDHITLSEIRDHPPSAIIISPGPGTPHDAGISLPIIEAFSGHIPILGVCLGHQCIGQVFGGKIAKAKTPMHGRFSFIHHSQKHLFHALANPLQVGRYHSLIVEKSSIMQHTLNIDATSPEDEIMALSHKKHPTFGVQFHPESILTKHGHILLDNFLKLAKQWSSNKEIKTRRAIESYNIRDYDQDNKN